MIKFGKMGMGALTLASLLALQACDVAVGYREGGWYRHERSYSGGYYRGGYRGGHHGGGFHGGGHRRGGHHMMSTFAVNKVESNPAQLLARDYKISVSSADKILRVTDGENPSAELKTLGLNSSDFAPLAKLEMPSSNSINRVASSLHESPAKIRELMQGYIADVKTGNANE